MKNDYNEYITSKEWNEKRKYIAEQRNFTCQMCNKIVTKGYHIHHLTYENFTNEKDEDLLFLCKECHEKIHYRNNKKNNDDLILSRKVLSSTEFKNMTYASQVLFIQMKCWANGKKQIFYSYTMASHILGSRVTTNRALKELIKNNFIRSENVGQKKLYTFLK